MKLLEILKFSEEYLSKYSFSKPRLEAEKLISHVLKLDRLGLYANFEAEVSQEERDSIKNFLKEMSKEKKTFDALDKGSFVDFKKINMELLEKTENYLKEQGVGDYKIDAKYIFAYVLETSPSLLGIQLSKEITKEALEEIKRMTIQRGKYRKPLQQILGQWEFYGYPFFVNENVLTPRSDTENLVETCKYILLEKLESKDEVKVLDIGAGSGAISITLGKEVPKSKVIGLDISPEALEVANRNRELNEATNVEFFQSDLFEIFEKKEGNNVETEKNIVSSYLGDVRGLKFDLIVSNPPYIPLHEYNELMPEVKNHEPRGALTDGGDGYFFYDTISKKASEYLVDGGVLAFEVGYNQSEKVSQFLERDGYVGISIIKDYCGVDRIVIGRKEIPQGER